MNDYISLLIATGRNADRLREADRDRLAAAVRRAPGRSIRDRLRRPAAGPAAGEPRPAIGRPGPRPQPAPSSREACAW
jgi:hypothetical protein